MSIFRRGSTWYADITVQSGKRVKQSLRTTDRKQAQELHDQLRANLWRVDKLGDYPDITFEEACVRWLEEKSDKKSIDTDKSSIGFWLEYYSGCLIKNITSACSAQLNQDTFLKEFCSYSMGGRSPLAV